MNVNNDKNNFFIVKPEVVPNDNISPKLKKLPNKINIKNSLVKKRNNDSGFLKNLFVHNGSFRDEEITKILNIK